jgi:regulator of protease activity HflC (stomatin/prohibitin superfamily)
MIEEKSKEFKWVRNGIIAVVLLILFFMFKPFTIVDAGNKGLKFRMGAIQNKVLDQGINWRMPLFESIKEITIRPMQLDESIPVASKGAVTKDNQTIGVDLTIFYSYRQDKLVSVYKDYGESTIKSIISTTLKESFKGVSGTYTIFELAMNQDEIRSKVFVQMTEKMANYPVIITELKTTNYDWSDEFDKQIAETMNRSQQVKQKEQEKLIAEQEAQKGVVKATAEKTMAITTAEGQKEAARLNAEAKALEGEGIRKYNESVAKNWDIELKKMQLQIEQTKANRWNGQYVPTNNYGPIPVQTGDMQGK